MTRDETRTQYAAIRADFADGKGVTRRGLSVKYKVSYSTVQRALMDEERYQRHLVQTQIRNDRNSQCYDSGKDRLLAMLQRVHGEPRSEIAPELMQRRRA